MKRRTSRQDSALAEEIFGKDKVRTDRAEAALLTYQQVIDDKYWKFPYIMMYSASCLSKSGSNQLINCLGCDKRWSFSDHPAALLAVKYLPSRRREVCGLCLACLRRPDNHQSIVQSLTHNFGLAIGNVSFKIWGHDLD